MSSALHPARRAGARCLSALALCLLACTREYEVLVPPDAGVDAGLDAGPVSGAFALSAGDSHTCAIRGGALWCWGLDSHGQLGLGDAGATPVGPSRVGSGLDWVEVSAGGIHTCARRLDGSVWCWGGNGAGQLGLGDGVDRSLPTRVPLPRAARQVQSKQGFSCAILDDASLWCWGANFEGQLALGDTFPGVDQLSPRPVPGDAGWSEVTTGQGHACARQLDGSLWCWGRNTAGMVARDPDAGVIQFRSPQRVGSGTDWLALDANQEYTCGLRADRSVWCWGDFFEGELDSPAQRSAGPTALVRSNLFHLCLVSSSGVASCWGRNLEGQLGLSDFMDRAAPTTLPGGPVSELSAGRFHTCLRRADGSLWCAGSNQTGQLGSGDAGNSSTWVPVEFPP